MPNEPEMRASDEDRDITVNRLREAHIEGRLSVDEFTDRLNAAYAARTYGELELVVRDIPAIRRKKPAQEAKLLPQPKPQPTVVPRPPRRSGGDQAMRVLWTIWACAVSVNLVVWLLVSFSADPYFWPVWVAGPSGAILFSIEAVRRLGR